MNSPHKYVENLERESLLNIRIDELSEKKLRLLCIMRRAAAYLHDVEKEMERLN